MELGTWLADARVRLERAGIASPALEAQILAATALGKDRAEVLAHQEWESSAEMNALLRRRLNQEPLAYITGATEFFGRSFKVKPGVLVPRQDTETFIDVWRSVESHLPANGRVLDLGTGTGCIGITLKLERPALQVTLSDISPLAIGLAKENAATLSADVTTAISDGLSAWKTLKNESFDAIVSNPPYVGLTEELAAEIKNYEPEQALFAGNTGLEFFERLAVEVSDVLVLNGLILVEVGYRQSLKARKVFEGEGHAHAGTYLDLSGNERVLAFLNRRRPD